MLDVKKNKQNAPLLPQQPGDTGEGAQYGSANQTYANVTPRPPEEDPAVDGDDIQNDEEKGTEETSYSELTPSKPQRNWPYWLTGTIGVLSAAAGAVLKFGPWKEVPSASSEAEDALFYGGIAVTGTTILAKLKSSCRKEVNQYDLEFETPESKATSKSKEPQHKKTIFQQCCSCLFSSSNQQATGKKSTLLPQASTKDETVESNETRTTGSINTGPTQEQTSNNGGLR